MEHSKNFEKVKYYYNTISPTTKERLWDITKVKNAVGKWITPVEFEEITGMSYIEE